MSKAQQEVANDKSFQGIPHPEHPVSGCYYDTLHNRVYMPPASWNRIKSYESYL